MVDELEVVGGQIWQQQDFPCHTRFVTLLGNGKFALLSDPREQGNVVATNEDGMYEYTEKQAIIHFRRLKYTCLGQLHELLLEPYERIVELKRERDVTNREHSALQDLVRDKDAELKRLRRTEELMMTAPRFQADDRLLGHLEGEIIAETGDGPFAAYVIKFLMDCQVLRSKLEATDLGKRNGKRDQLVTMAELEKQFNGFAQHVFHELAMVHTRTVEPRFEALEWAVKPWWKRLWLRLTLGTWLERKPKEEPEEPVQEENTPETVDIEPDPVSEEPETPEHQTRICASCGTPFVVHGAHRICPVCRVKVNRE